METNAERNAAELEQLREADWKELHWQLRSLAQQRVALEAREANLLLIAEESRLHVRLGYSSLLEYMERELHYGPHAANERLRVARELLSLPLIAEQFKAGELSFSAVRELTRVATPETEHLFLTKAHGKTARDVERMVAGLKRGDDPEAEPDPRRIKKYIRLEVSAPTYARYTRYRTEIDKRREERISDDELFGMFLAERPATDQVTPPRVHVAVTTCKRCKQSFVSADGEHVPIDTKVAEALTCDATYIGDLETDDLTRPKDHIPAALRRKVLQRDGFACVVPGCRAKGNVSVHHGKERQHGGQHTCGNMCTVRWPPSADPRWPARHYRHCSRSDLRVEARRLRGDGAERTTARIYRRSRRRRAAPHRALRRRFSPTGDRADLLRFRQLKSRRLHRRLRRPLQSRSRWFSDN